MKKVATIKLAADMQGSPIARRRLRCLGFWGAALMCCANTGCVVGPKYHAPVTQAPTVYKETPSAQPAQNTDTGTWTVAQPQDAMLRGNWWEVFHEPELNVLEEQLNINNQNIKLYFENFMEARALITRGSLAILPDSFDRSLVSTNPVLSQSQKRLYGDWIEWRRNRLRQCRQHRAADQYLLFAARHYLGARYLGQGTE